MNYHSFIIKLYIPLMCTLPCSALADYAHVVNSISVSSQTGGQHTSGRSVSNGSSEVVVDSRTVVNGVVVEETHTRSATSTSLHTDTVHTDTKHNIPTFDTRADATPTQPYIESAKEISNKARAVFTQSGSVRPVEQTTTIINTFNTPVIADSHNEDSANTPSPIARIIHALHRTISYVTSNIFSF